ncbi:MAG: putative cytokinetic ring protein SteA [Candidatus Geothermincolia bacterium]
MKPSAKAVLPKNGEGVTAIARLDKKTKNLVKRLHEGEIAIIDHTDIDRVSAESLIESKPACIVNAACSLTGTYPNLGPLTIVASGITIVDEVGKEIFESVHEGDILEVRGAVILRDGEEIASGNVLTLDEIEQRIEESKTRLGKHLGDFAANTVALLEAEKEILLESVDLPHLKTRFDDQHALIVVRGHDYKKDLAALRSYIREVRPVLIAVDGGADALLEAGYKPRMIVGDMDSVTDAALRGKAELVVHGYADGRAPGKVRLDQMGLESTVFHYPGTSEDIAMLIAFEKGAEMIALVGGHNTLIEFLDKDRKGMASTFLVRLRIGATLVDAKGVSELYHARVKGWHLALMALAALLTIIIIIIFSEPVRQFITVIAMRFQVWLMKLQNLI